MGQLDVGTKTVAGVDGRMWSVRRSVAWSLPATGDDFEHDVDGGRGAAVLILSSLFLFWVIIVVWSPGQVHVPWYIWTRRGASSCCSSPSGGGCAGPGRSSPRPRATTSSPAERWTGLIRGGSRAREEMRIVVRRLRTQGTPGHADSPLQPVN